MTAKITTLPVMPLRDIVVFPNMIVPLFVARDKAVVALERAMEKDKQIFLVTQLDPGEDDPDRDALYDVGVTATIMQLLKLPDGTVRVLVEGGERGRLEGAIQAVRKISRELEDTAEMIELAEEEGDEGLVNDAVEALGQLAERAELDKTEALLAGEADANDSYIEIHAGAGGTESQDWAEMLLRMYTRWCERSGFELDEADRQLGEEAGIKGATIFVRGEYAFGWLRAEEGVHRLVRELREDRGRVPALRRRGRDERLREGAPVL